MMLSMNMIMEALERSFKIVSAARCESLFPSQLTSAALFRGGAISDDTLYVAEARRLPVRWKRGEQISMVIAGNVEEEYFSQSNVNYICLDNTKLADVLNAVLAVFKEYARFDDAIKNAVIHGENPDLICETFTEFAGNPIVIFDQLLRVLYLSPEADHLFNWETDAFSGMRLLPTDFVNQMYIERNSSTAVELGNSMMLCGDRLQYNLICTTGKSPAYVMLVLEINKPLTNGVLQLTEHTSEYILYAIDASRKNSSIGGLASCITAMLEGVKFSDAELDDILGTVGWTKDDNCCCIVMTTDTGIKDPLYNSTFCLRLENQFHSCVVFSYKENVVAVLNLDKSECTVKDIPNRIGVLLRDGLFHAGISFKYWVFATTPIYYEQACSALELGRIYSPTTWCYSFVDFALRHIMHYGFSRIPAYHLCYPGLVQLYIYDQDNHTDLLHTLKVYEDCGYNAALTAKKLYIHRNTFYQRMNKIHEILDLNLEDRDTRLYIQISNYIIKMYNYETNSEPMK